MTLPSPNLDSRTFRQLVDEARTRIPRYAPEWTNLNDSDPGMTLVKLHAWLTETILHELNRVPELNYIAFLNLLGITTTPAQPARAELEVTLDKLDAPEDPRIVAVPQHSKVAVDDPDLPRAVVFETDRTLLALNAHIGALLADSRTVEAPVAGPSTVGPAPDHALVTRYDDGVHWPASFAPFPDPSTAPSPHPLYLGLLLRPQVNQKLENYSEDRMPAGPLDLYVDAVQANDPLPDDRRADAPPSLACPPPGSATPPTVRLTWQAYTGGSTAAEAVFDGTESTAVWTDLAVPLDGTVDLTQSGHVVLEIPAGLTPVSPALLPVSFWTGFGHVRPPRTADDLITAIKTMDILPGLAERWDAMGIDDPDDVLALAACKESAAQTIAKIESLPADRKPDPSLLAFEEWVKVSPDFAVDLPQYDGQLRPLYWIRAIVRLPYPKNAPPATLQAVHLNTVPATQAETRLEDRLGVSSGRPAQVFTLPASPVLIDPVTGEPDLDLQVGRELARWSLQADFHGSGPEDEHFTLDADTGTITFGDGIRGAIPSAGAVVQAGRYRTGGGSIGNVPAGTISKVKGRIRHVKSVSNLRAANRGQDAETLDAVKRRAPQLLRTRDVATTAQDFADLVLRTPGQHFHAAYALARQVPDGAGGLLAKDGAVTVVVLPHHDVPAPLPTEAELRAVCEWLEPRRLVTTELHVMPPSYTRIERMAVRVGVHPGHDLITVTDALYTGLLNFLHPIRGGRDGRGWPFGADLYLADVYDLMLGVPGVHRVRDLAVEVEGTTPDPQDVLPFAPGHLPHLVRDVIQVVAGYE